MKVLFTYDYGEEKFERIRRELGYEVVLIRESDFKEEEVDYSVDVLCCYNSFERMHLSKFTNLKLIQLSSIGFDSLPKEEILGLGLIVANNRGGYSVPMGEFIVFNMLQMAKHNRRLMDQQRNRVWKIDTTLTELCGKNVVFIGTGTIAREGAKRLQGFDMQVIGLNTRGGRGEFFDQIFPIEKAKEVLPLADYLVMTLPYTKKTHHYLNRQRLSWLKPSVCLVNVSRGSVIDEQAMISALEEGRIAAAALDVFEQEPLSEGSKLWHLENVYLTPHNSWISELRNERRFSLIFENLRRVKSGEAILNQIDVARGY